MIIFPMEKLDLTLKKKHIINISHSTNFLDLLLPSCSTSTYFTVSTRCSIASAIIEFLLW